MIVKFDCGGQRRKRNYATLGCSCMVKYVFAQFLNLSNWRKCTTYEHSVQIGGAGAEVCKNLILAGINLALCDEGLVDAACVKTNVFLRDSDVIIYIYILVDCP